MEIVNDGVNKCKSSEELDKALDLCRTIMRGVDQGHFKEMAEEVRSFPYLKQKIKEEICRDLEQRRAFDAGTLLNPFMEYRLWYYVSFKVWWMIRGRQNKGIPEYLDLKRGENCAAGVALKYLKNGESPSIEGIEAIDEHLPPKDWRRVAYREEVAACRDEDRILEDEDFANSQIKEKKEVYRVDFMPWRFRAKDDQEALQILKELLETRQVPGIEQVERVDVTLWGR